MDEVDHGHHDAAPLSGRAGDVLRQAREALGLTLADIGARTRIPLRHLQAIETSDYSELPSATYAVGFAKAYARSVGADEIAIARQVRGDVADMGPRRPLYEPYEIVDQTRVPPRGLVIVGLGVALAILIVIAVWFGTGWFRGGQGAATTVAAGPTVSAPVPEPTRIARPNPAGGQVTLTATDEVWLEVYDADGKRLRTGTMKAGDRFDVPRDAKDPKINVGRPDKLTVTLNGSAAPPLGDGARPIKGIGVSAAAVAARLAGGATPVAAPTPAPAPAPGAGPSPTAD